MSVVQVLERPSRTGGRDVEFEKLTGVLDFRKLETDGRVASLWGSKRIIELGSALRSLGFRAYDCAVVDHRFGPVDDAAVVDAKDGLLNLINTEQSAAALELFGRELPNTILLSLAMRGHGDHAYKIRLAQNGSVEVPGDEDQTDALSLLKQVIESAG